MATLELKPGSISQIELEGELNISSAVELKERLARALGSGTGIQVSLAHVSAVDITAVQLFWATRRQAGMAGIAFSFATPVPEHILAGLDDAGISRACFLEGEC